jgi:hypothetical protein
VTHFDGFRALVFSRMAAVAGGAILKTRLKGDEKMSTDYRISKQIQTADFFDRRLEQLGVHEHVAKGTTDRAKCITDGRNFLWVYIDDQGIISSLTRYGGNVPSKILAAIAEAFKTDIFSEYEPQFWGFDTQEQWDAAMEELSRESEERFYGELIKFVSGKPSNIAEGTIGHIKAQIAKKLVENDPQVLLTEARQAFMNRIEEIYDRDHSVKVSLTDKDMALVRMLATHEDDLGQA